MSEYVMPPEVVADERARAMAAIDCWLKRDEQGFNAVVGSDADAATLLPIAIGELCTALEGLTSAQQLRREVSNWLSEHRRRLSEAA